MESAVPPSPAGRAKLDGDAHGRAALLLIESLVHGLIARSVLTVAEGVSIMETALEVQIETNDDAMSPTPAMKQAAMQLSRLVASLKIDLADEK